MMNYRKGLLRIMLVVNVPIFTPSSYGIWSDYGCVASMQGYVDQYRAELKSGKLSDFMREYTADELDKVSRYREECRTSAQAHTLHLWAFPLGSAVLTFCGIWIARGFKPS